MTKPVKPVTGVPPDTKDANRQMQVILIERLSKLDQAEKDLDKKLKDRAYSTPEQQAALNQAKTDIGSACAVLQKEQELRKSLDTALGPPEDISASKAALSRLDEHRKKSYPKFYTNGARVGNPCMPCLKKHIDSVRPAFQPADAEQMAETVTGIFEGGSPATVPWPISQMI